MKRIISYILVFAMILTMMPVAFAASTDYELKMGEGSYTAEPGSTIAIPVYFTSTSTAAEKLGVFQTTIAIPEGFAFTVDSGVLSNKDASVSATQIKVLSEAEEDFANTDALFTLNCTVPTTEGTYTLEFGSKTTKIKDRESGDNIAKANITVTGATIEVKATTPAPEQPSNDFELKMGEGVYTAEAGATIAIPVYFISAPTVTEKLGVFQTTIAIPEGFAFTVDSGVLSNKDISVSATQIKVLSEAEEDFANTDALFTLNCTVPTTAGTYALEFGSKTTKIKDRESGDNIDKTKITITGATITVEGGVTPPPAPTLESITVNPTAVEVPYGADALTAVKAAITAVTATYSDATTASVTDYAVEISADGAKAIVTYEGKTAEIALTYEPAPVVLTDIAVDPSAFEVPYGTVDVLEAVKGAITAVVAKYSDGSTAPVTDYTVVLEGTDKAVVTYEGKTAEIALTYEEAPQPPVTVNDFELKMGEGVYTAEAGATIAIPVYFISAPTVTEKLGVFQTTIAIPEGFAFTVDSGVLSNKDISVSATQIKVLSEAEEDFANTDALFTLNCTVPTTAGTYALEFGSKTTKIKDRESGDNIDKTKITITGATITVEGGVTPPAPTLESITVNPTAVEVPYGVDAKVAVEDAITGVTAVYSDGTTAPVTGYEVTVDGDVATVTYEGKTATIALTFAKPPVTDVEIIVAVNAIVVPYNITVPVDVYAISQVGEVKVKDSEGAERVVEAQITYDEAASAVIVAYADLAPVSIPVTVITLVDYTIGGITGVIEIPYDCADPAGYVKGIITVTANLSDGSTMEIPYFTVEVNADWTAADVLVNGEKIEVVDTKKGAEPVAAITGIKVEVADAIVVPYGTDDVAAYIKSKIVVKTVDEDGVETAISDYTVVANDGYADIAYGEFTESVDFTVETAQLVANVTAIEIPYTVAEADYAAYIAQNVALTIDYSANTADKAVVATAADVVIDADVAIITIEGLVVEVPFTVQAAPEYIATAVPAYGLAGKVLVKITGVADGKVAVVNGLEATYFGNGNFAVVVDEAYTVELTDVAAMPAVAEFGKLHPAGVTAWDALVTNDEALEKDVDVFEDIQMYVLADLDGNGKIEAIDALNINKISLFQGTVDVPTWVDAE